MELSFDAQFGEPLRLYFGSCAARIWSVPSAEDKIVKSKWKDL